MADTLKVIAPLAIVRNQRGEQVYLYKGAVVPDFVSDERKSQLRDEGFFGTEADLLEQENEQARRVAEARGDIAPAAAAAGPSEEEISASTDESGAPSARADKATHVLYATDPARGDAAMTEDEANAASISTIRERFGLPT